MSWETMHRAALKWLSVSDEQRENQRRTLPQLVHQLEEHMRIHRWLYEQPDDQQGRGTKGEGVGEMEVYFPRPNHRALYGVQASAQQHVGEKDSAPVSSTLLSLGYVRGDAAPLETTVAGMQDVARGRVPGLSFGSSTPAVEGAALDALLEGVAVALRATCREATAAYAYRNEIPRAIFEHHADLAKSREGAAAQSRLGDCHGRLLMLVACRDSLRQLEGNRKRDRCQKEDGDDERRLPCYSMAAWRGAMERLAHGKGDGCEWSEDDVAVAVAPGSSHLLLTRKDIVGSITHVAPQLA